MGILRDNLKAFGIALDKVDDELDSVCPFDKKTEELFRFALSIKGRSAPCVRKHFKGARAADASDAEIAYAFALTMQGSTLSGSTAYGYLPGTGTAASGSGRPQV